MTRFRTKPLPRRSAASSMGSASCWPARRFTAARSFANTSSRSILRAVPTARPRFSVPKDFRRPLRTPRWPTRRVDTRWITTTRNCRRRRIACSACSPIRPCRSSPPRSRWASASACRAARSSKRSSPASRSNAKSPRPSNRITTFEASTAPARSARLAPPRARRGC